MELKNTVENTSTTATTLLTEPQSVVLHTGYCHCRAVRFTVMVRKLSIIILVVTSYIFFWLSFTFVKHTDRKV